jgi:peptide/nickel transport system ATP-binding protein
LEEENTMSIASETMSKPSTGSKTLLKLEDVSVTLHRLGRTVPLVRDASFEVRSGEIVCLVGESGSGKSVTARTIMGLTQMDPNMRVSGTATFDARDVLHDDGVTRQLRGRDMAMVFQEPLSSLDPVFTVESQLTEALRRSAGAASRQAEKAKMVELLAEVGIRDGERVLRSYPHQLSGGMCQRVMIASALACAPRLLIADEPTTALDVTIQAQILELIDKLRHENDMSVLLVTHDMGVAADLADRVVVMYAGEVVEDAAPTDIFNQQEHPYTAGLLACIPPMIGDRPAKLPAIPGGVPDPAALPAGCAFAPRCHISTDECRTENPPLLQIHGRSAACWNRDDAIRLSRHLNSLTSNGEAK